MSYDLDFAWRIPPMKIFRPTWNHLRDPVYDAHMLPQCPPETIAKHQGYEIPEVKDEPTSANS